ncbi:pyridoxal phosphate-dependent transferase [Microdochium trichocladiopsis]|uniref:Pyridoxal phosphate-dependent transferase n=1 Tax=Microdochium trichocladiopsis TaxID=1682393 RepID=A0A9P8Y0I9_9PEZI|nr:pyridoxal phosphate-dependent transferase [Microdochium trichocladiopsis]KAH7026493.1 pyridoxal phosphate-dependent transferase [Microdochium trichocladiopsis]
MTRNITTESASAAAAVAADSTKPNGTTAAAPAPTWLGHEGAGAFDLRSDTMTTPTPAMLAAIQSATLLDDVMQEDTTTSSLEAHVAALTGKQAGLFALSGTMGNQLALRALLVQPPYSVLCDHRAHIVCYEAGGVSSLTGAMTVPLVPRNGRYLTLEDIKARVVLGEDHEGGGDVHSCPTRVISLENTLGGVVMPLAETRRIAQFTRQHGIKMHLDGARLWEVVAAGREGSLVDFGECFDTMTMCFSKGLGAPVGSILVGDTKVIRHARWTRKAIGGGVRQPGFITAAARVALDTTFGKGPNGEGGLLRKTHDTAKRVEKMWTDLGGVMAQPVETNMCWLDLGSMNTNGARVTELGREVGLKLMGNRIITHYQIGEEALSRLAQVFARIAQEKDHVRKSSVAAKSSEPYGDGTNGHQ